MKKLLQLDEMDLQLFAEGASGADSGAGQSPATGGTADDAGQRNTGDDGAGTQPGASADAGQENLDPAAAFDALIKGQYKEQYDANVRAILNGRLKGLNKQLQSFQEGQAVYDVLGPMYGLDPTDYAGIAKAVENDTRFVEKEALETGKTPEDLLELRKVQRENASMRRQMELERQQKDEQRRQQQASEQESAWRRQAEETQKVYPGMNLDEEIKNPDFARLLRSGVPVKAAYEVTHMNDILGGAMQYAAQRAAKSVTDNVIAGTARPAENGTVAQGAVATKVDPSKFTSKEIKEYRERAARGERITFE